MAALMVVLGGGVCEGDEGGAEELMAKTVAVTDETDRFATQPSRM